MAKDVLKGKQTLKVPHFVDEANDRIEAIKQKIAARYPAFVAVNA